MKDDGFDYSHAKVLLQRNRQFFVATVEPRIERKEEIDTSNLETTPIPLEHIYPMLPTQAPNSLSVDVYIKSPNIFEYGDCPGLTDVSNLIMHEAQMCERTRRSPHPNVARYFGCHIDESGSIVGLCFKKYSQTLDELVEADEALDLPKCLSDIKAGIEHLHSLGIIHCDIKPHNIFLDESTFVVGDFDSCAFEGDKLGIKAGTQDWTNEDCKLAQREND
ncbi:serine/threonine-protein kinase-like protein [Lophium mytilinum]|uniref:Serine/threonine-protein kinase-like protein n=1 Tax=Lophium mytilinum TaxID=390894 RepID=A0A6A6Q988_9PEZI|nr:serine/threonine-protein kinase-like protein [Lophium mytilinum]